MPFTPQQGFSYPNQLVDPPCQLTTIFDALAGEVDIKSSGLDVDAARVGNNNAVKISKTGFVGAAGSLVTPTFDTVEFNRGTPTDLTVVNGLILNPGYWLTGLEISVTAKLTGTITATLIPVGGGASNEFTNGWTQELAAAYPANGWWPNQYITVIDFIEVKASSSQIRWSTNITDSVPYMTMWAVQLGDI